MGSGTTGLRLERCRSHESYPQLSPVLASRRHRFQYRRSVRLTGGHVAQSLVWEQGKRVDKIEKVLLLAESCR